MRQWTATIYETISRRCRYVVEADTVSEASDLLLRGETLEEELLSQEVTDRVLEGEIG